MILLASFLTSYFYWETAPWFAWLFDILMTPYTTFCCCFPLKFEGCEPCFEVYNGWFAFEEVSEVLGARVAFLMELPAPALSFLTEVGWSLWLGLFVKPLDSILFISLSLFDSLVCSVLTASFKVDCVSVGLETGLEVIFYAFDALMGGSFAGLYIRATLLG